MKYRVSKFNYFKQINQTIVGASFINKVLFALERDKYALFLSHKDNLNDLEVKDPTFFSLLYKLGIIELEEDNYSNLLLLQNRQIVFNSSFYRLTINPTLNCNFSCWYCYETHTKKRMTKKIINSTIKYINHLVVNEKITALDLDWFGGEPLLCYSNVMIPIALAAKKVCEEHHVTLASGITTNGYLITEEMIPFFREVNMRSFQITLDGSKDIHDTIRFHNGKKQSYDTIVNNIILIARELKPENLALRINYTQETLKDVPKIIDAFPKDIRERVTVLLQQVWQDKDNTQIKVGEIENTKQLFENAGFKTEKRIFNFKGYTCYADMNRQAVINYDGRVFKCTARNFEKEEEEGILTEEGQIIWSDIKLPRILSKATFENEECMDCKYLPLCFGPCSQKMSILKDMTDFKKYCFKGGIESTLDFIMEEFEKTGNALAPPTSISIIY